MSDRFRIGGAPHGTLARRCPVHDGAFVKTGLAVMMRQQLGLALHNVRIVLLQSLRDALVELPVLLT